MTGRQTLGELLRRRIRDYEYTVEQVAELVGMTPGGMYRLIEGKMPRLSDGMKYRICLVLDIAPSVMEEGMRSGKG